jgi:hypothetical protein
MLTIEQIAYRNAQKFNSVPRQDRTEERLDGAFGVPESVFFEITENLGSCTRDQEREYLKLYNQYCDK